MSVAAIDHPFFTQLIGDREAAAFFTVECELEAYRKFELKLAEAQAELGIIPEEAYQAIAKGLMHFKADVQAIQDGIAQDGVVVTSLVSQMRNGIDAPYRQYLHFDSTSQDVIDTGLALRLAKLFPLYRERLVALIAALDLLDARDGSLNVMAHTRMQAAIPVTAARKIASWRDPLTRSLARLDDVEKDVAILHLGGAAGTLSKIGDKADALTHELARLLGLGAVARPRHSERDGIVAFASVLALITGSLGKFGQDVALLAQSEVNELNLATGGGSSAMPHKKNPVPAEMLVTLARFNATLISGMQQSMVHENERSGAAWTLEWMILPQMAVATAAALRQALVLTNAISFNAIKAPR